MSELMCDDAEPVYDRTRENLRSSDLMVSAVRKKLLDATGKLRDSGEVPPNLDDPAVDRARAVTLLLDPDDDWRAASETARSATPEVPATFQVPLVVD